VGGNLSAKGADRVHDGGKKKRTGADFGERHWPAVKELAADKCGQKTPEKGYGVETSKGGGFIIVPATGGTREFLD